MNALANFSYWPVWILLASACTAVAIIFLYRRWIARRLSNPHNLPYPPGPEPFPIIGNLLDVARENEAEAYQLLAQKYGDLVFLSVIGKHILFVNSFQHAYEIFERRSANYSDRELSVMCNELMGWDFSFGHMRYGDRWKKHRRVFHTQFQQSMIPNYHPTIRNETHSLLRHLLHSPNNLDYHLRQNAAAVIMGVVYGIPITSTEDRYIQIAETALEGMAKAASPGAFLVDVLPFLKYVPEWMPGASFQRKAREWKKSVDEMREAPFRAVQKAVNLGQARPSFCSALLNEMDQKDNFEDQLNIIKNCAGMAYAAGAESTVSALSSFVLAIVLNPGVQTRAQQELDKVLGRDRLPELSDRPSLPYINAILKEILRWNPVAPLALPHMATHDDDYNGYFIPSGTLIIGNSWGILHDPQLFPEPHRFMPDRFMETHVSQHFSAVDPLSVTFGYGRRTCPGKYMAEAQIWLSIACILSVFNISPALDADGNKVEVVPSFSSGFISMPRPFEFAMKPRDDVARGLIEQTNI